MTKTPTNWSPNISAEANQYAFDSSTLAYDSATQNYDGVVDADLADTDKTPVVWSGV